MLAATSTRSYRPYRCLHRIATSCALVCVMLSGCTSVHIVEERLPEAAPAAKAPSTQKPKTSPAANTKAKRAPTEKVQQGKDTNQKTTHPVEPQEAIPPRPMPAQPIAPISSPVAIIVSKDIAAYTRIADALATRLRQRGKVYRLHGSRAANDKVISEIQRSNRQQVVAIGLRAAKAARQLSGKQVIFCQVFNYQDYDLITPWMKGVSMVPQLSGLFSVWKALDPTLQRVGLITGDRHEGVVNEARRAARIHGITIVHRLVSTDKETLHAFKSLAPDIQGLWLLPDNRVLSRQVVRAVMAYSVKQGKQVSVFHPQLLNVGGLISVRSRDSDVVNQVLARLGRSQASPTIPGPDVIPLTKTQLRINAAMANHLGLIIPRQYRPLIYEP
ncbi:MAG: ABC transporter substrate-binding protein [Acidiferrobacterales bacterium]